MPRASPTTNLLAPLPHAAAAPTVQGAWPSRDHWEGSLAALETALAGQPRCAELHCRRAGTLYMLGRDSEARSAYVQALERDPDHLDALRSLGKALVVNRNHAAALLVLERAVARHPHDGASHVSLGIARYQAGDPAGARQALEAALRIAPDDAAAHTGMAFVLEALGEADAARRHRRAGFRGRGVIALPYRGALAPRRVLLFASTGSANAPIDRFLDDATFQTWIVVPEFQDAGLPLPPHDLIVNAIGDADADRPALLRAAELLAHAQAPVVNAPGTILASGRCANWQRLAGATDVLTPRALSLPRARLAAADAQDLLQRHGLDFPLLLRTPGYHGGEHFERVETAAQLPKVLAMLPGDDLLAVQFCDTRSADGKTRKYRVMMIDGALYPLHLAVGQRWKLHYFSADMSASAAHRAEDERFLEDMAGVLGARAMQALQRIPDSLGLDYGGIDFGLSPSGEVVLFEANATMIVPPPPADACWDYRRRAVERIETAVRRMLLDRSDPGRQAGPARAAVRRRAAASAQVANDLNFSAGPGALPREVLLDVQQAIIELPETGRSVLGMSHRSAWFERLLDEAEANLRELLQIPETHGVAFLQGGSSLQFSMIPMNLAASGTPDPLHVRSGYWSQRAIAEANCVRPVRIAWDGAGGGYRHMPGAADWTEWMAAAQSAPYLHYVSNETVEGLQCRATPRGSGATLVADMSSDFLSQPVDCAAHGLIYAHAQKNLGPAGVTVCVIDRRLLERIPSGLPPMLDYRTHLTHRSNYNTPPVFGIYVTTLVTRWLRDQIGGVARMGQRNRAKAGRLYATLDRLGDVLEVHAAPGSRSCMNASFRFRDPSIDAQFLVQAAAAGFSGLEGHRSLGGVRVSMYNAVPPEAVARLCDFLEEFAATRAALPRRS
jgi:phosphoserine aminotransferase